LSICGHLFDDVVFVIVGSSIQHIDC
jgi:hypothetical protein